MRLVQLISMSTLVVATLLLAFWVVFLDPASAHNISGDTTLLTLQQEAPQTL